MQIVIGLESLSLETHAGGHLYVPSTVCAGGRHDNDTILDFIDREFRSDGTDLCLQISDKIYGSDQLQKGPCFFGCRVNRSCG